MQLNCAFSTFFGRERSTCWQPASKSTGPNATQRTDYQSQAMFCLPISPAKYENILWRHVTRERLYRYAHPWAAPSCLWLCGSENLYQKVMEGEDVELVVHFYLTWYFNPRPAGGGGGRLNAPLRFFEDSENTVTRSAAGFSPTLRPIFSATFVKISTQGHVRSGHQVRSSDPTTK